MDITVRVEVQYVAPEHALIRDVLQMFRTPAWVRFMVRYISPHLKNAAPADKSVVDSLEAWTLRGVESPSCHGADALSPCVICMSDVTAVYESASSSSSSSTGTTTGTSSDAVQLPCGHCFHHGCIQSWLKLRSTCPSCRFQFRKAFSGSYAVKTLNSALLLKQEHRYAAKDDILSTCVGKETVRAVVNVTLSQIASQTKRSQYPCVLNALMMHSNGESFSETVAVDKSAMDSTASPRTVSSPPPSVGMVRSASEMFASGSPSASASATVSGAGSVAASSSAFEGERRSKRLRVL